ncbi:hypothetical protein Ddye_000084 [Dipteronia dyeriana]|uniref:Uncharacterized protein n=1 Tax=Dipteronia dyeriana TaxID=168575 RepID=A0AAE0CS15_9ROSI|nr:hypothetical protein Ddye_000084 [Dipteronia dyeriana]
MIFLAEDVKRTVFDMSLLKAPGKDGLPAMFYQKYRSKIGRSVTTCCLNVLNCGGLVEDFNSTIITLIPKIQAPEAVSDFRSFSLCNVLYKIIAKFITNRFRVEWDFIGKMMISMGFPEREVRQVLDSYEKSSGQVINYNKSAMCVSPSVSISEGRRLAALVGVNLVECHEKYLGCVLGFDGVVMRKCKRYIGANGSGYNVGKELQCGPYVSNNSVVERWWTCLWKLDIPLKRRPFPPGVNNSLSVPFNVTTWKLRTKDGIKSIAKWLMMSVKGGLVLGCQCLSYCQKHSFWQ